MSDELTREFQSHYDTLRAFVRRRVRSIELAADILHRAAMSSRPVDSILRERAADWAVRLDAGDCSTEEIKQLDAWLAADPSHRAALDSARSLWLELNVPALEAVRRSPVRLARETQAHRSFRCGNADGGYELLHSFTQSVNGTNPRGRFARGANGKLYLAVGDSDFGKILEIDIGYTPPHTQITSFAATPAGVFVGASTTLSWTTQNTNECTASGEWSGTKAASGSEEVTLSSARDYSFTLDCTGASNSDRATIIVTASTPPPAQINSFTTSASTVPRGANVTLSWQARDTNGCTASGAWSGAKAASGSENITFNTDGNHTYRLTCVGLGGDAASAVSVMVTAPPTVDARSGGGSFQPLWLVLIALLGATWRRSKLPC